MISRRIGFGLGVALSTASVCLTWNVPVLAQDAAPAPAADEPGAAAPAAEGEAAEGQAPEEAPAEPPPAPEEPPLAPEGAPPSAPEDPPLEGPATPPEPPPPASAARAADPSVRGTTVTAVGLEHLPGDAYPAIYTRGIKYGSLWKTFHGQQWPYMPELGAPGIRVGFSGYFWNDLSNARIDADQDLAGAGVNDQNRWTTQTRGVLRVTPTYNAGDDWFVQGNAEIVVQGDMRPDPGTGVTTTTDDVYVRVGKWNLFDVTVGRFQAWEIANHYGMGLDYATLERSGAWIVSSSLPRPSNGYALDYYWDRQNFLLGTYAAHVYPTKYLRGELLGHVGAGNSSNASNPYQMDIRPSAIFDIGWVKLKAGYEYGKAIPQDKTQKVRDSKNGWGAAAQFVLDPYVEFGGSFARGYQDILDQNGNPDLTGSNTVQTFGGFLNASPGYEPLVIGFGAFWNSWENLRYNAETDDEDTNQQIQVFGAVQYTVWERLLLKLVVAHASNKVEHFQAGEYINNSLSGRFRVELLY
ncbi:MAG TPA: hypothetical protein VFU02_08790 [Polyangiaceae bacterium]|nr:hypothetical protein [Polyangiaceae bacterium]